MIIHGKSEIYRVYAYNKQLALQTFLGACDEYSETNNVDYNKYWCDMKKEVASGKYTLIESEDFIGVRKIA